MSIINAIEVVPEVLNAIDFLAQHAAKNPPSNVNEVMSIKSFLLNSIRKIEIAEQAQEAAPSQPNEQAKLQS